MRLPALLVLAFVASGCTIHVVEQPATPVLMAEAPRPTRARPLHHDPVAATPTPAPPHTHAPSVVLPARPARIPFKTVAPETRDTHLARIAPPTRKRGPQKVKRPEPLTKLSSTSVAKAQ
jgi:hypothetical protein